MTRGVRRSGNDQSTSTAEKRGWSRPFRTYRGVRFTRSQIYLIVDVSAIKKLTILSARVWTLANTHKNRVKSPLSYNSRKKSVSNSDLSPNFNFIN